MAISKEQPKLASPTPPTKGSLTDDIVGQMLDYYGEDGLDDAGGYGDPHRDTTPEFVKEDEAGWLRLFNWRRKR